MTVGYHQGRLPGENRGRLMVGLHVRQYGFSYGGLTLFAVDLIHRLHPDGEVLRDLSGPDAAISNQEDT